MVICSPKPLQSILRMTTPGRLGIAGTAPAFGLKRLPFMSEPFLPMLLLSPLTRRCRQFNGMTPRSTTRYA